MGGKPEQYGAVEAKGRQCERRWLMSNVTEGQVKQGRTKKCLIMIAEISDTGKCSLNGIVGVGTTRENKQQNENKVHASVYQHCIAQEKQVWSFCK